MFLSVIIRKNLENLPSVKATTYCSSKLTKCINEAFTKETFPDTSKLRISVYKKLDPSDIAN